MPTDRGVDKQMWCVCNGILLNHINKKGTQ